MFPSIHNIQQHDQSGTMYYLLDRGRREERESIPPSTRYRQTLAVRSEEAAKLFQIRIQQGSFLTKDQRHANEVV